MKAFNIAVTGLKGGHSGMDINLGRANANKIIIRLLKSLVREYGIRIASIDGGSLRNAIPREAFAKVVVPAEKVNAFTACIKEFTSIIQNEFSGTEPNLAIEAKATEMPSIVMGSVCQETIINVVYALSLIHILTLPTKA